MAAVFRTAWRAREKKLSFSRKEAFLLHNFDVQIVLFELDNLIKNSSEGKKI